MSRTLLVVLYQFLNFIGIFYFFILSMENNIGPIFWKIRILFSYKKKKIHTPIMLKPIHSYAISTQYIKSRIILFNNPMK